MLYPRLLLIVTLTSSKYLSSKLFVMATYDAIHRVFKAHNDGILTGLTICPGLIYGVGTGPGNKKSIQIPKFVE